MDMRIHMRWHLPLGSTATLLLCVVMVFLSLPPAVARGQTPAAADTQTPNLAAKSRKDKLPSELARSVRDAIVDGRYEAASQVGEAVLAKSRITAWRYYPFTNFIAAISNDNDVRFEARLSQWVSADPQAALPTLVRAQYYYDTAWFRRGHRFDNDTLPADLAAFHDNLRRARTDVESAIELDGANPYAYYLKLIILRGLGDFSGEQRFLEQAIAKFPAYYPLYDEGLAMREPRWGGTVQAMRQFVDRYAGQTEPYSPLKVLYVSLYRRILIANSIECSVFFSDRSNATDCVRTLMKQQAGPDLEHEVVAALQIYDHADHYEFGLVVKDILLDMLQASGGETYAGAALQLAASAMHSDTQLVENDPGHNDYIIDAVVAQSWSWKGFYDNAISKNREALRDIDKSEFPDEAARDLATSTIYLQMLDPLSYQSRFDDVVAYSRAALDLGNQVDWEHYICYAYYEKREYKAALADCTKAVDDDSGNMLARYWRGLVYQELGNMDAALNDFTAVADSENSYRASAAITVSWIYDTKKEFTEAIDSLNKYTYLYDEKSVRKDDVAVAYNNRCYAYMQIGELQKALDDCTQSLKYGSIPDAFEKQQELVKRLGLSRG
ncbi:tetratricopeptide repeat protein [Mesorhizobium huakuii]|uniref:Tetratricopeptide repeat protein n=1 Tax=Mesorhizobium huakuii TaxID=28104 RepID=A0A7G6STX1_9HYPH|nr:tetratricopeptide repeat protein [Mesorhizobium huakuii]QND57953.1 tetratricopeptide repeat protein [Mesorhizobium huakuii]